MPAAAFLRPALRQTWQQFLDLLYPRLCQGCQVPLSTKAPREGSAAWFCPKCSDGLMPVEAPYCSVCGEPFDGAMTTTFRCSNCEGRRMAFDFAVAAYKAEGPLRQMILRFKYGKILAMRAGLADMLAGALKDPRLEGEELSDWLLVPVPLHFSKHWVRGFNQSWELCRLLSQKTGIPAAQLLRRTARTRSQARLFRKMRLQNLRGAFSLRKPLLWGRGTDLKHQSVLLVDDVLTTGATAHECAKVLKRQGGAEKVVVITVARG